jgi:hypothetical protein
MANYYTGTMNHISAVRKMDHQSRCIESNHWMLFIMLLIALSHLLEICQLNDYET